MTYLLALQLALGGENRVQIHGLRPTAAQFLSLQSDLRHGIGQRKRMD